MVAMYLEAIAKINSAAMTIAIVFTATGVLLPFARL